MEVKENFFLASFDISTLNKNIIKEEIKELCSDEYFYWFEQLPLSILNKIKLDELLMMAALNGSIKCTEYLLKVYKIECLILYQFYSIIVKGSKNNHTRYVLWALKNLKSENQTTEKKRNIEYECDEIFNSVILNNNLVLFKEFEKKDFLKKYIEDKKYELLKQMCERKNTFELLKYFLTFYDFENIQIIKKVFIQILFFNYDIFELIYEKVKLNLKVKDKEKFLHNNYLILKILMVFKDDPVYTKDMAEMQLHRLISFSTCSSGKSYKERVFNDYHDTNFKNVFRYLYFKFELTLQDKKSLYNRVVSINYFRYKSYLCEFLIDDGLEIESYKEPYYDYYMYKKRIRERLEYNKYNNIYEKDSLSI